MRSFQIGAPDGRRLTREAETVAALQETLVPGYTVEGEVLSGLVVPPLPDGLPQYSLITYLLREHGDELREWIAKEVSTTLKMDLDGEALGRLIQDHVKAAFKRAPAHKP